ncbi:MAG TPA: class A beta-lactamase-related serine hydrolase [bacterium]|nr:class A beta-lactamase-related serine hydrolase [bacterium]
MKITRAILAGLLLAAAAGAQSPQIPAYARRDDALSAHLAAIVRALDLDRAFDTGEDGLEQISLAVIDLSGKQPRLGGVHMDNFIYPASVYKMYVAAAILDQISQGRLGLTTPHIVRPANAVDRSKEWTSDPRPLLQAGDTVTVNYLLDLMITRSDNSAANCLIDIARRPSIDSLMHRYGWFGSEVTRKFLKRTFEDSGYATVRGTETCALHAADFLGRIATRQLVSPWVSMQMLCLLGRQLDNSKLAAGLPPGAMFYHKTGWYASWTHDAGLVDDGRVRYVIACFLPLPEELARAKHRQLAEQIHALMLSRR